VWLWIRDSTPPRHRRVECCRRDWATLPRHDGLLQQQPQRPVLKLHGVPVSGKGPRQRGSRGNGFSTNLLDALGTSHNAAEKGLQGDSQRRQLIGAANIRRGGSCERECRRRRRAETTTRRGSASNAQRNKVPHRDLFGGRIFSQRARRRHKAANRAVGCWQGRPVCPPCPSAP
jgi:hypothetical protein